MSPFVLSTRLPVSASLRAAAATAVALLLLVAVAPSAAAHTALESSDPPSGVAVGAPLDGIELTFSAPVQLLEQSVVAVSGDGRRISAVEVRDDDGLLVGATFTEALEAGDWTVRWRVLASDSHPRTGEVLVRVVDEAGQGSSDAGAAAGTGVAPSSGAPTDPATPQQAPVTDTPPAAAGPGDEPLTGALERAGMRRACSSTSDSSSRLASPSSPRVRIPVCPHERLGWRGSRCSVHWSGSWPAGRRSRSTSRRCPATASRVPSTSARGGPSSGPDSALPCCCARSG